MDDNATQSQAHQPEISQDAQLVGGRYRIGAKIDEGGFGAVFRGTDEQTGNTVAIKRFINTVGRREVDIASQIDHAHIVKCLDVLLHAGSILLIMEFAERGSALNLIGSYDSPRLPSEDVVVSVIREVASGLHYLHAREPHIIHRDVKLENILLFEDGAKLCDVGIAKQTAHSLTPHTGVHTAAYASPEMLFEHVVGPASDVWSLAVTAHVLLTGAFPFKTFSDLQGARLPSLQNVPVRWRRVFESCLTRNPKQRWAASDVLAFLKQGTSQ